MVSDLFMDLLMRMASLAVSNIGMSCRLGLFCARNLTVGGAVACLAGLAWGAVGPSSANRDLTVRLHNSSLPIVILLPVDRERGWDTLEK